MEYMTTDQVSLPPLNKKGSSPTPNVPIGGYLTLPRIMLTEPSRMFNINLYQKHRSVAGTVSPEAFVPDVHSDWWSM